VGIFFFFRSPVTWSRALGYRMANGSYSVGILNFLFYMEFLLGQIHIKCRFSLFEKKGIYCKWVFIESHTNIPRFKPGVHCTICNLRNCKEDDIFARSGLIYNPIISSPLMPLILSFRVIIENIRFLPCSLSTIH
jgi:hypothetical protein